MLSFSRRVIGGLGNRYGSEFMRIEGNSSSVVRRIYAGTCVNRDFEPTVANDSFSIENPTSFQSLNMTRFRNAASIVETNAVRSLPEQFVTVLNDPRILTEAFGAAYRFIRQQLRRELVGNGLPEAISVASPRQIQLEMTWEKLKSTFNCTICNDVLAAPMKTNCGHMSCYTCLQQYLKTELTCPSQGCPNQNIRDAQFAQDIDMVIASYAEDLDDSPERDAWDNRRERYYADVSGPYTPTTPGGHPPKCDDDPEASSSTIFGWDRKLLKKQLIVMYVFLILGVMAEVK